MTRPLAGIGIVALLTTAGFSQTAERPAAFDIADVHVSPRMTNTSMRGGVLRAGRYTVRNATMVQLISAAYGIEPEKVKGGPGWLDMARFDIVAMAPVSTAPEVLQPMLQTLLADRFQLKVHRDTKPLPVYALVLGKGKPKLKPSEGSESKGCQGQPQNGQPGNVPTIVIACHNLTMEQFAQDLRDRSSFGVGAYLGVPVVDQTGLKGSWDFDLKWMPRNALAAAGPDGITIFDAVDKQLGLKLEPQKLPMPVIVVDSVNQKPTGNPADLTAKLPPPPPAVFEVAVIKPSKPGATNQRGRLDHGRLDVENLSLRTLISIAWDLNSDELLADAPKFLESAHFDITAKAAPPPPGTEVDFDDLRQMLQALLADRFKLKTHLEDRPVEGYVLTAVRPRLAKADLSNRAGCKEGPGVDGKDPRISNPALNRLISCQNVTIEQFADSLQRMVAGYVHVGILDATGLTDTYDLTVSFSGINLLPGGRLSPARAGENGTASDPGGAISLPEAVSRQLGLKMELKKRPMQVLVIDHVEETPTEN